MATTTQLSDETSLQTEPNEITLIKRFSPKEVAEHNSLEDIWIIVDGGVYDLTKFLSEHPGGKKILQGVAGKDASKKFHKYHRKTTLAEYNRLRIGDLGSGKKKAIFFGLKLGNS
ncbi:uncharacterized protein BHQ10_009939 [Talaromyces amestolkiae]|uniref:Cytochrome b5 heme-binding domain-containing protein n=1 Tax=Talaromyces amestolkiae TaxID=1196081 RepID=A0A364LDQ7_TALAM|nr:uncharacterized protein BHQ10_009939 [Talaromyces amestolkiae]RAO73927.1 hypothetical protein BHQ10_009939 [Talaromyces amestolkiae]